MTLDMRMTEYEGFPDQYGREYVRRLNEVVSASSTHHNNDDLQTIGQRVDPKVIHRAMGRIVTRDGYDWFGSLEFRLDTARAVFLFPWCQDFKNPESKLERSIQLYTNGPIADDRLMTLSNRLAQAFVDYDRERAERIAQANAKLDAEEGTLSPTKERGHFSI